MAQSNIVIDRDVIAEFCRKHRISWLALFGSVLRDDFGPDSDVDVLVQLEPGVRLGLIGLAGLEIELSQLLGTKADIRMPEDLSHYFRDRVVRGAEVYYDRAA